MYAAKEMCRRFGLLVLITAMLLFTVSFPGFAAGAAGSGVQDTGVIGFSAGAVQASCPEAAVDIKHYAVSPQANDYYISDTVGLSAFAELVSEGTHFSGKTVYLKADLDCSALSGFMPIGTASCITAASGALDAIGAAYFSGVFEGLGHKLDNLKISVGSVAETTSRDTCVADIGLFGVLRGATVQNLILGEGCVFENLYAGDGSFAGVVAGRVVNDGSATTKIVNVYSKATLRGASVAGGLIGRARSNTTELQGCTNAGTVSASSYSAGMIGWLQGVTRLTDCRNTGTVLLSEEAAEGIVAASGMVARQDGNRLFLTDCINNGEITGMYASGILGYAQNAKETTVKDCRSYGAVSGALYSGAVCAYACATGTNTYSLKIDGTVLAAEFGKDAPNCNIGAREVRTDMTLLPSMLSIAIQLTAGSNIDSDAVDLRILSSIDKIDGYRHAGFEVTFVKPDGTTSGRLEYKVHSVYKTVLERSGDTVAAACADELFSPISEYFSVVNFEEITNADFGMRVEVNAFAVCEDGTKITGKEVSFTVRDHLQRIGAPVILNEDIIVGRVDAEEPMKYQGWPTVCVDENDTLYAVCSGNRLEHVDPFGETWMYKSTDGGLTWSAPVTVNGGDGRYLDNRDAGITYLGNGKMVLNYFRLATYEYHVTDSYTPAASNLLWQDMLTKYHAESKTDVTVADVLAKWDTMTAIEKEGGAFVRVSYDYGATWSEEYPTPISSPHGPTVLTKEFTLSDGNGNCTILAPGTLVFVGRSTYAVPYRERTGDQTEYRSNTCYAIYSTDDGKTWHYMAALNDLQDGTLLREPYAVQLPSGDIFSVFRTNDDINTEFELYTNTLFSGTDGTAHAWGSPQATGIEGVPAHLLQMGNGALLMTYGWRLPTYGQHARVSYDGGKTWGEEFILSAVKNPQASKSDLGYPTTVRLSDGTLVTVYYQPSGSDKHPSILCTRWRFGA